MKNNNGIQSHCKNVKDATDGHGQAHNVFLSQKRKEDLRDALILDVVDRATLDLWRFTTLT
jgi:hypothetical protein